MGAVYPLLLLNLADSSQEDGSTESLMIEESSLSVMTTAHQTESTTKTPEGINDDIFK
tara:strand:+ start:526 stop:699 length:174 start_codon:yes stop_codon:yes gene_type:complete